MPNELKFKLVDAFAKSPYSGNVAGVVFDADDLSDKQMQAIAAEFNASETTFVLKPTTRDAAVRFRWFAPSSEVSFCGHATIGAVHALLEDGRLPHALDEPGTILPIEFCDGILNVRTEHIEGTTQPDTIWLDMPHSEPKQTNVVVLPLTRHLGLSEDMIDTGFVPIRTHDEDIMFAVQTLPVLLEMQPNMGELARYCRKEGLRGVFVTTTNTLSRSSIVQSRFFAPAVGVDEDPVTGSAHGPLGLHLVNSGIVTMTGDRADFHCTQAKAGGRAGLVRVVVTETSDGKHVRIGGSCVTTASGTLQQTPKI
ncbi:MAG: PhzF family phenazine biosynthesis protein [Phycisphaerales bacterium]|nr:PhzF family phenazine biosynthesis protein [Phycisphaerales bacterium]